MPAVFNIAPPAPTLSDSLTRLKTRYAFEPEFTQAVEEVAHSIAPVCNKHPHYLPIFKALCEPERLVQFRIDWVDDAGQWQHNLGYRVQFNSALGPYKGGLRFHPSVNLSILKFLGFEQTFKNALTGLALGGAKGGSDFDPKGKSLREIRSFCQAFMTQLAREIGPSVDVPAGDIGVGTREIGFLYGQYRKLSRSFDGALTGKGLLWGGSHLRPEATGYGAVYFANTLLRDMGCSSGVSGKRCVLSGAGNAAQFCAQKLIDEGAHVLSLSDTSGTLAFRKGLPARLLTLIAHHKNESRSTLRDFYHRNSDEAMQFYPQCAPWAIFDRTELAFPCATQNEIDASDIQSLLVTGCLGIVEVANMPCTAAAVKAMQAAGKWIAPSKAANAGGVAVSGLEMAQNSSKLQWSASHVEGLLKQIMENIYHEAKKAAKDYGSEDLISGANIAGFLKVASSMREQGAF